MSRFNRAIGKKILLYFIFVELIMTSFVHVFEWGLPNLIGTTKFFTGMKHLNVEGLIWFVCFLTSLAGLYWVYKTTLKMLLITGLIESIVSKEEIAEFKELWRKWTTKGKSALSEEELRLLKFYIDNSDLPDDFNQNYLEGKMTWFQRITLYFIGAIVIVGLISPYLSAKKKNEHSLDSK